MHSSIVNLYLDRMAAKDKLNALREAEATIEEYNVAYENCSRELKSARKKFRIRYKSSLQ